MAEKVVELKLVRDYKKFLYFIDGAGNVMQREKGKEGQASVVVPNAVQRDNNFLYFIDKDGDISRSARASRKKKEAASA